jgi:hypothetical protein
MNKAEVSYDNNWLLTLFIFATILRRKKNNLNIGRSGVGVAVQKVSSKFGIYKSFVFREILAHSSSSHISDYANRDF